MKLHFQNDNTMTLSEYFIGGGLIEILRRNTGGTPPRLWLTQDAQGFFHRVFSEPSDGVGGEPIPFNTVFKNKVFRPNLDEVLAYLQTLKFQTPNYDACQ
jgi:hypothetical protein